jgi:FMN phosphatase YigB (HAD superfamily)
VLEKTKEIIRLKMLVSSMSLSRPVTNPPTTQLPTLHDSEMLTSFVVTVQVDRVPMPQVPETLARLSALGIKLVAISDTESGEAGVRKTLRQLKIEDCFDEVVSSFAIGHVKPEPEAFDYAIQATGRPKSECGFVAHDIDEPKDAQALLAIGYNYHFNAPADIYVDEFSDLLSLL